MPNKLSSMIGNGDFCTMSNKGLTISFPTATTITASTTTTSSNKTSNKKLRTFAVAVACLVFSQAFRSQFSETITTTPTIAVAVVVVAVIVVVVVVAAVAVAV